MKKLDIDRLLELIQEAVNSDGSWTEKRDAILAQCTEDERTALDEFACWFAMEGKA